MTDDFNPRRDAASMPAKGAQRPNYSANDANYATDAAKWARENAEGSERYVARRSEREWGPNVFSAPGAYDAADAAARVRGRDSR